MKAIKFLGIQKSSNRSKKYTALFTVNGKPLQVDFGAAGYEDYTTHKDIKRMRLYRIRHAKDNITNPLTPGALSWYILWSAPSLRDGISNYKSAFNFQ